MNLQPLVHGAHSVELSFLPEWHHGMVKESRLVTVNLTKGWIDYFFTRGEAKFGVAVLTGIAPQKFTRLDCFMTRSY